MSRSVLTLELRDDPGAIAAYREHHRRVWPEVQESLRRAGVRHMEILIHGRRLVMILELDTGVDLRRVARRVVGGDGSSLPPFMTAPAAARIDAHQHFWRYDPAQYKWIDDAM